MTTLNCIDVYTMQQAYNFDCARSDLIPNKSIANKYILQENY